MGGVGDFTAQSLISLNFRSFSASSVANCSSEPPALRRVLQMLCDVAEQYNWREKKISRSATELLSSKIRHFYITLQK